MLSLVFALVFAALPQDGAAGELKVVCEKMAGAESYSFKITVENSGAGPRAGGGRRGRDGADGEDGASGRRGGRGGDGEDGARGGRGRGGDEDVRGARGGQRGAGRNRNLATEGSYQKGLPIHLKQGKAEAYRLGDQMVYQAGKDGWKTFESGANRQGGREARGRGGRGDRGEGNERRRGGERGEDGERSERGRRGATNGMTLQALQGASLPHELLKMIADGCTDVQRKVKGGSVIYAASLSDELATKLAGPSNRGGRGNAASKGAGSMRLSIKNGSVEFIELDVQSKISFGERSMERIRKTKIEFSKVGKTKVRVPDDAQSKLKV